MTPLRLSTLPHTWLIDVDGVIVPHNGHLRGDETLLPGVRELWASIPPGDRIVLLSARGEEHRAATLALMAAKGLRVDHTLFGLPPGERILINDTKPGGLRTAPVMWPARIKIAKFKPRLAISHRGGLDRR